MHSAIFYEALPQLWEQVGNLLRQAPWRDAPWLYLADEQSVAATGEGLAAAGVSQVRGAVRATEEFHLREQVIRVRPIQVALEAILQGSEAPRLILIEMTWTIRTPSGVIYLREFEAAMHHLCERYQVGICCLYNRSLLLDEQLITGLCAHPELYTSEGTQANHYFLPPHIFVRRDRRAQFDYWLQKIAPELGQSAAVAGRLPEATPSPSDVYHIDAPALRIAEQVEEGRWKIRCLGPLRVYRADGSTIHWDVSPGASTRKVKTLFAFLLYRGEQGATGEELADLLWPEAGDTHQALNRLYHVVRFLRMALSPGLKRGEASPYVLHQNNRYHLAVPSDTWIDLPMFQELCFTGNDHLRQGKLQEALTAYQAADRLYQGHLLADLPEKYTENADQDWCWSRRYWYRDMRHKLLHGLASIHRQLGQYSEALACADQALALEPCSEPAHQEKMRTLQAAGRGDALHRQYRLYCQALDRHGMGTPTEATRQLFLELSQKK